MTRAATATKPRPPKEAPEPQGMRLTVNRAEFLRALGHATAIVERRNTIPVLSNVLVEAADGKVRLTATDLNMQVAINVPANVEAEGSTTVQAALLHGIVREFDDGSQVELSLGDGRLQVVSGRSRYRLQVLPADQFPVLRADAFLADFALPAKDFAAALRKVGLAQSVELVSRFYLCGVYLHTRDGELCLAATEGNLLAETKLVAPEEVEVAGAILPTKFVDRIGKLLEDHDGDFRLKLEAGKVIADLGDTVLISKLVDGTYPDYRRVIPTNNEKRLQIAAASLAGAVRRASIVGSERLRAVKLSLSLDKLVASCTSNVNGTAAEEAPCVWDSGEFEVGVNARYLQDVLDASGAEEVELHLADPASPMLFTNPADESSRWVVMPIRV